MPENLLNLTVGPKDLHSDASTLGRIITVSRPDGRELTATTLGLRPMGPEGQRLEFQGAFEHPEPTVLGQPVPPGWLAWSDFMAAAQVAQKVQDETGLSTHVESALMGRLLAIGQDRRRFQVLVGAVLRRARRDEAVVWDYRRKRYAVQRPRRTAAA